jgi:uncharacterized protein YjbI with pentapeptide repeats
MANAEHLSILKQSAEAWNNWKLDNVNIKPDFTGADLSGADLSEADLSNADLSGADLSKTDLSQANLSQADLSKTDLSQANLSQAGLVYATLKSANLSQADLSQALLLFANLPYATLKSANLYRAKLGMASFYEANLSQANLSEANLGFTNLLMADLRGANLSGAQLWSASLVRTNCEGAVFTGSHVFGISVWDVNLIGADQRNLIITLDDQPVITVDNLEVAQFIYLLLHNERVRHVIDTITSKVVLILGRFTPDRKVVLDALREHLRTLDYLPVLFDFDKPASRDITETVSTLAHMARFVIADITDAKSIPQELKAIVPNLPSVPVQPLLLSSQHEYGMFEHFRRYPWVLPIYLYEDQEALLQSLDSGIISPAVKKAQELQS